MKNQLLLTLALGVAGAVSVKATTVDVYITGSTAFRANCFTASQRLYATAPTVYYADNAHGGGSQGQTKASSWVMTGTPIASLTTIAGDTLVIHGLFTGSIQGVQAVENQQPLTWAQPTGSLVGTNLTSSSYVNNSATIAFSDADSTSTPYPYSASGNFAQENVCVQPFVVVKSQGGGVVTNINNVSFEQLYYGFPAGRIPGSAWSNNSSDSNNWVYIDFRTLDSGTRRCSTAGEFYQFNDPVNVYLYDATNNDFYFANNLAATNFTFGFSNSPTAFASVLGSEGAGLGNANLNWGSGYIGGGDIANTLNLPNTANEAISVLSLSDSKSVGSSNWANVVSFDGVWPTRAGAGLHGNGGTNDFSPITQGYYPIWGYEVIVFANTSSGLASDQDITLGQLGDNTGSHPGSFISVFNNQATSGGTPITGSIENEIYLTETTGSLQATAIRLTEMSSNRQQVGGKIFPF